jgi:hypothetical protein
VRDGSFYPEALEKGQRSERALMIALDASRRRALAAYTFDLAKLEETPVRLI